MASRSPRPTSPPLLGSLPDLSSILPPPHAPTEDSALTLIDEITSLMSGPGWRWLIGYATAEWGSKAVRARLHAANANGLDLASLGALTQSTLAAALAVERLLNAPNDMLMRLRIERGKHVRVRQQGGTA